jgi:hypothetical protein
MTKLYTGSVNEFKIKRTYLSVSATYPAHVACCVFFFSFYTFFILKHMQTWKIVDYKLANCATILFIYVYVVGRG